MLLRLGDLLWIPTFRRNVLPPYSGRNNPKDQYRQVFAQFHGDICEESDMRWMDDINIEIGFELGPWTELFQDSVQQRALVLAMPWSVHTQTTVPSSFPSVIWFARPCEPVTNMAGCLSRGAQCLRSNCKLVRGIPAVGAHPSSLRPFHHPSSLLAALPRTLFFSLFLDRLRERSHWTDAAFQVFSNAERRVGDCSLCP
jgi:hypothetical protein